MPERFLEGENSKIDYRGQDFELISFGAGRRICPAIHLASRMASFVLASLLHSFEWKLPYGMDGELLDVSDMTDEFGVTFKQSNTIPVPRLPHHIY
ncbi:hypothetical protein SUGI_0649080 [Cryptomeria japonica]|nr:hypothetical protein SUGI_0649080 [Cryptomeria japonica]